jgi:hypothetical protein
VKQNPVRGGPFGDEAEAPTTGHVQLVALGFTRKHAPAGAGPRAPLRGIASVPGGDRMGETERAEGGADR